jgi:anti-anti-sigma factor
MGIHGTRQQRIFGMTIKSEMREDVLVFQIEIKRATVEIAEALREKLIHHIKEGKKKIVVGLGQVEFVDSSFLSSLMAGLKQASSQNGDLKLAEVQPSVRYILQITRLEKVFEVYDTVEEALKKF